METATKTIYKFGAVEYNLSARSHVMGVLNITPDSFSDGGDYCDPDVAAGRALEMVEEGADFIDIGGESTRPGAEPVSLEEELSRIIPVINKVVKLTNIPVSIDTYKTAVAERALDEGAVIVNDITGLRAESGMAELIAQRGASVILMHMKGTPRTMQQDPQYNDVVREVSDSLKESAVLAERAGIEQIILDPGIGFGKTVEHNLEIIRRLSEFEALGHPVLVGPSRKSFIGKVLDLPVSDRLEGTAAAVAASIMNGASIVRVHDVKQIKRVCRMVDAIISS